MLVFHGAKGPCQALSYSLTTSFSFSGGKVATSSSGVRSSGSIERLVIKCLDILGKGALGLNRLICLFVIEFYFSSNCLTNAV